MTAVIDGLGFPVVPVPEASSAKVAEACARWGKGFHAASLNFGDCFAYALARELERPLLFVGEDFSKTDIEAI